MEPILTKQEIAELLTAIKAGKISTDFTDPQPGQTGRFLNAQDLDLFRTYEQGLGNEEMRIPNYDIVMDSFSHAFGTNLTNTLQRNFSVQREELSTNSFQQSLQALHNQGAIGIYSTPPLRFGCLFHFDTSLAFAMLEIMLGAGQSGESQVLDRQLTTIELAILRTIMTSLCADLEKAMRPVTDLQVLLNKVENNFRMVNIVDPETEMLVTLFNVRLGGEPCGQMRLLIPYLTLEPFRDKFKGLVTIAQAATYNWAKHFTRELMDMENEVVACSGKIPMTIRTILALKQGDIIELNYNPDQPLIIQVEDHPLFSAIAGERNGKKAFHVISRYSKSIGGIHGGH